MKNKENILDLIEQRTTHDGCPDKCFRCKYEREKIIQKYASDDKDYYEITCPHCGLAFRYRDEREDGWIECYHCDEDIDIEKANKS